MKLKDFKGLFTSSYVEFIKATNVYEDYYEIELKPGKDINWTPGMHAIFTLPNNKIKGKKFRAFSIASTAKENKILLGTRTGKEVSSFKEVLLNMKAGEKVKMRGPFGWFYLMNNTAPIVMIALGVGITPIRALLTELKHKSDREVNVIYSSPYYMYKEHIDGIVEHNKSIKVDYLTTVEETEAKYIEHANQYGNKAYYYISGTQNAIKSIKNTLKQKGIKKSRMIFDPFLGY